MFFDPWPMVHAIVQAQMQADEAQWQADFAARQHEDFMRERRRFGSIDVEARWVDENQARISLTPTKGQP